MRLATAKLLVLVARRRSHLPHPILSFFLFDRSQCASHDDDDGGHQHPAPLPLSYVPSEV